MLFGMVEVGSERPENTSPAAPLDRAIVVVDQFAQHVKTMTLHNWAITGKLFLAKCGSHHGCLPPTWGTSSVITSVIKCGFFGLKS